MFLPTLRDFISPYFDHDTFMHHILHVLDASGPTQHYCFGDPTVYACEYIIMRVLYIKWVPEMQCAVWWAVPSKCAVVEKMLGSTAVGPIVGSIEERILLAMLPEELNNGSHWIANFRYI